jgi:hypothetical protein
MPAKRKSKGVAKKAAKVSSRVKSPKKRTAPKAAKRTARAKPRPKKATPVAPRRAKNASKPRIEGKKPTKNPKKGLTRGSKAKTPARPPTSPAATAPTTKGSHRLGRSWLAGEATIEEIRSLTRSFEGAEPLFDDDLLIESAYDIVVVDGDLDIDGDLETFKHNLIGLIVRGNLTVGGLYSDTDDPATGVFVLGDMTCARMVTTGELGVQGSLNVTEVLAGFYNDYSATIRGNVTTPLLHPENHHFEIGGKLSASHIVGHGAEYRFGASMRELAKSMIPGELRPVLVDEVLVSDGDGEADEDVELDSSAFIDRVRRGLPVRRPPAS